MRLITCVFIPLAAFSNLTRSLRLTDATCRSILENAQATRRQNDILLELLKCQKKENSKLNSYLQAKLPNLGDYFPLKDSPTLARFMDNSDGLFSLRRGEMYNLMLTCVHEKKNIFATSLLNTFFSTEFIMTHTWPTHK